MSERPGAADTEPRSRILRVLDEHRIMAVATLRPDGWPHATLVGYVHEDLTLYFVVARDSQKLANIQHDPRVSIAIGGDDPHGLSMAARASLVEDFAEIDRLNRVVRARYPEQAVFAPRSGFAAIMRATPVVISLIDLSVGWSRPELFDVAADGSLRALKPPPEA